MEIAKKIVLAVGIAAGLAMLSASAAEAPEVPTVAKDYSVSDALAECLNGHPVAMGDGEVLTCKVKRPRGKR